MADLATCDYILSPNVLKVQVKQPWEKIILENAWAIKTLVLL